MWKTAVLVTALATSADAQEGPGLGARYYDWLNVTPCIDSIALWERLGNGDLDPSLQNMILAYLTGVANVLYGNAGDFEWALSAIYDLCDIADDVTVSQIVAGAARSRGLTE